MKDLDNSLHFNLSRFSSNGWQNLQFDEASQDILDNRNHSVNHSVFQFNALLNEPPRASIYNCIESNEQDHPGIRNIEYIPNEPEAKHVNPKQYFRMMKQRIKKSKQQLLNASPLEFLTCQKGNRQYLYESRHQHAIKRKRGDDGKFVATRPPHQRFREKKKRGRKPKIVLPTLDSKPTQQSKHRESDQNLPK